VAEHATVDVDPDSGARTSPGRRQVLKLVGAGVALGFGTSIAGASPDGTPGDFEVLASSPECETIELEYVNGKAPVTVVVSGPAMYTEILGRNDRSRTLRDVPPGSYTVDAQPGREYDAEEDSPVTVRGSSLVVEGCLALNISASFACAFDGAATLVLDNPNNVDIIVELSTNNNRPTPIYAPASSTRFYEYVTADGITTLALQAETVAGETVSVNGETTYIATPEC
jgi:hypothetical protein